MKILFVNPGGQSQGGAERSLALLIEGLADRGHEPLVALLARGDAATVFRDAGATIVGILADELRVAPRHAGVGRFVAGAALAAPTVLRIVRDLRQICALQQPDVVHSNGFRSHLLSPLLAPGSAPIVWSLRDRAPRALHRRLLQASTIGATAIIANSEFTAEQVADGHTTVHTIGNPVTAPKSMPITAARRQLGLPTDRHIVSVLAHLHRSKGHDVMLDAMAEWSTDLRPHLVIAGGHLYGDSSDYETTLRSIVNERGMTDHVTFLGNVDDVAPVYAASDVVVHPCRHPEGFGRVIVEAQLAGVPVVATGLGGVLELVRDEENGLLVPPDDHVALHEAVDAAMWPGQRRTRLIAGGSVAGRHFTVDTHVEQVLDVYRNVAGLEQPEPNCFQSPTPIEVAEPLNASDGQ